MSSGPKSGALAYTGVDYPRFCNSVAKCSKSGLVRMKNQTVGGQFKFCAADQAVSNRPVLTEGAPQVRGPKRDDQPAETLSIHIVKMQLMWFRLRNVLTVFVTTIRALLRQTLS